MKHISTLKSSLVLPGAFLVFAFGTVAITGLFLSWFTAGDAPMNREVLALTAASLAPITGAILVLGAVDGVLAHRWKRSILREIAATYGMRFDADAVKALGYPEAKPISIDPISFGTITISSDSDPLGRQITLIWNGEQMALAERGCELKPLPTRDLIAG